MFSHTTLTMSFPGCHGSPRRVLGTTTLSAGASRGQSELVGASGRPGCCHVRFGMSLVRNERQELRCSITCGFRARVHRRGTKAEWSEAG